MRKAVLIFALAALLAGCGDNDKPTPTPTTTATAPACNRSSTPRSDSVAGVGSASARMGSV